MNNLKKVGLTALAGSLAAVSANAAEMSVSGATMLTYTSKGPSEVTGNPFGMKTNLSFTASGDVNGYTVSYMQTSADKFAGMSSARMSIDLGDMGTLAFDQGSGSGLSTIDDKTPTAGEEIWDGLNGATGDENGLVGNSNYGAWNYVGNYAGMGVNASFTKGSSVANSDGGASGAGNGGSSWDIAITGSGSALGMEGLALGVGYGDISNDAEATDEHLTAFANYTTGMVTIGVQQSQITKGAAGGVDQTTLAGGIAININDDLSVSYGKRHVDYKEDKANSAKVQEVGDGINVAYTMGSAKILVTHNEVDGNIGAAGSSDENTEVALSFAF
jgi:outer membrane protein OmpU|tara:strand:+ start:231 stop:1223 length:993 start_codon:yes stop_codon:yes gene_type:complete